MTMKNWKEFITFNFNVMTGKRYYAVQFLMSQWFIGLLKFISKLKQKS